MYKRSSYKEGIQEEEEEEEDGRRGWPEAAAYRGVTDVG